MQWPSSLKWLYEGFSEKICADAGVTTGALYFFFKNKNDLFKAIVDEPLKELCKLLTEHYMQDAQDMDSDDPAVLSAEYHIDTHTDLDKLVEYMYLHYDVFMLLLTGAQGSEYENTVDMIVDMTEQGFRISAEKLPQKCLTATLMSICFIG